MYRIHVTTNYNDGRTVSSQELQEVLGLGELEDKLTHIIATTSQASSYVFVVVRVADPMREAFGSLNSV